MVRIIGRCLPIICLPKKKRQSLTIADQKGTSNRHHQEKVNKLFVRRVESIRVTQQGAAIRHIPSTIKESPKAVERKTKHKNLKKKAVKSLKADDTEFDCETHLSDEPLKKKSAKKKVEKQDENPKQEVQLEKLFKKGKSATKKKETRPKSSSSSSSSTSSPSDWSTSSYSDSQSSEKSEDSIHSVHFRQSAPVSFTTPAKLGSKAQSCVESFYLAKEHVRATSPKSSVHNKRQPGKSSSAKSKQVLENVRKMMKDQQENDETFVKTKQRESVRL